LRCAARKMDDAAHAVWIAARIDIEANLPPIGAAKLGRDNVGSIWRTAAHVENDLLARPGPLRLPRRRASLPPARRIAVHRDGLRSLARTSTDHVVSIIWYRSSLDRLIPWYNGEPGLSVTRTGSRP